MVAGDATTGRGGRLIVWLSPPHTACRSSGPRATSPTTCHSMRPESCAWDSGRPTASPCTVTSLARDPQRRAELSAAGRELYERDFDWPVLARGLRTHLDV